MSKMVIFHKTPSIWNKMEWLNGHFNGKFVVKQNPIQWTNELQSLIDSDIYIQLCLQIKEILGVGELHIVQGYDPNEDRNWIVSEEVGRHKLADDVIYWSINDVNNLGFFMDFDIIFTRGNYTNLHNTISDSIQGQANIWLHYPATSVKYPHFNQYSKFVESGIRKGNIDLSLVNNNLDAMMIELEINKHRPHNLIPSDKIKYIGKKIKKSNKASTNPYTVVLCDDKNFSKEFSKIYEGTSILSFNKPCLAPIIDIKFERFYDITFCGTTLQETKNHMLFAQFLEHFDKMTSTEIRVAVAGDFGNRPSFTNSISREYKNIVVDVFGEIPRQELQQLFNNSRSMIVLSGRDSNPRILQEAGICGARVLVADILSEGQQLITKNKMIGAVIKTGKESWFYQKNGNLKFQMTPQITNRISRELTKSHHPFIVAENCRELYDIRNTAERICDFVESSFF